MGRKHGGSCALSLDYWMDDGASAKMGGGRGGGWGAGIKNSVVDELNIMCLLDIQVEEPSRPVGI